MPSGALAALISWVVKSSVIGLEAHSFVVTHT